jgi:hypothetical protein
VDPKCRKVIEGFEKQVYKEGTQVPDKSDGHDHMNDAIGYGCEFLYPIRTAQAAPPAGTWTVGTTATKTR